MINGIWHEFGKKAGYGTDGADYASGKVGRAFGKAGVISGMLTKRRTVMRLLVGAVMTALILTSGPQTMTAIDTATKSKEMAGAIEAARKKVKETEAAIADIKQQSAGINRKLHDLELENDELREDKTRLEAQIKEAETTLLQRQNEQLEAEKRLVAKREEYQQRVAAMFYFKQKSPYEILLASNGIEGFFSNIRMIGAIAKSDRNIINDLQYAEDLKRAATEIATKTRDEFNTFLKEKVAEIEKLQEGISVAKDQAGQLSGLLQNRTMELQDVQKDLQQKEAAFQAYQAALSKYKGQISLLNPAGSNAVWPLPAGRQISSPYGYRALGFDTANGYMHTGTDFSGPNVAGTPVVAAWEGVVMTVHCPYPGRMTAPDANYVQISHGGGLGTGYWHLLNTAVSPGQHVAKGQVIGYCGSTGMSTGPHLHFEVYDEKNPKRGIRNTIDPMLYLGG
ncbi:hypothetical protein B7R76_05620 [Mageeibacillus indolicus]|uniref:M23ase beta-sheet core domain-containing protein n=1 Tax=Mageeibacillus indolicus TaxID=884684 RepID=A0A2J8B0N1_9FIRM|nr:peptidoglycan DD-metalloendopeptidase family protein [Mageeibacillus indolicus]PNH18322.1 hypothetical protein B7R76_05620 [Mageeibacillus indolicus]